MRIVRYSLIVAALVTASCTSVGSFLGGDGEVKYSTDADENLKWGDQALLSKNHAEAAKYYEYVKTKFPFLEASKTAELRLADTDFDRERFVEARDRYQNFVRLHPTHPKVDYAAFRAASTHYKDIPTDFFLLPPSTEKDQVEVRSALAAMREFLRLYPTSEFKPEADKAVLEVERRLAKHELYVADFYRIRNRWPAVVGRLTGVAAAYPNVGYEEDIYFGLYDAYRKLKDEPKAQSALRTLIAKYPDTTAAKRAKRELGAALEAPAPVETPDAGG